MSVTPQMVKELRERTGAGMMDCKNALLETKGDMEQAIDHLRKKGLASAAKKAGRVTAEGAVASYIHAGGKIGVFAYGDVVLRQSRIMTTQGGDIDVFVANGDIDAGSGPKVLITNPAISNICDVNGFCYINPNGAVTGAGVAALLTVPGQDPSNSNVTLAAPRGIIDLGAAGVRAGGTLLLREDDLVVVVAPGRRAVATANEASDDIEAFDLAVLEIAKAEHRARLRFSQLVHGFPFW